MFKHIQKDLFQTSVSLSTASKQQCLESEAEHPLAGHEDTKKKLVLGGDGRADSPGHIARYGTYSLLELLYNMITDFQLVQVRYISYNNNFT